MENMSGCRMAEEKKKTTIQYKTKSYTGKGARTGTDQLQHRNDLDCAEEEEGGGAGRGCPGGKDRSSDTGHCVLDLP